MRGRLPKTGQYTGDGSNAVSVDLGFEAMMVLVYNETDGDVLALGVNGIADGKGLKIVDSGSGTTDLSFMSSNGITIGKQGFKIGTDANLIENAKVFRWIAF